MALSVVTLMLACATHASARSLEHLRFNDKDIASRQAPIGSYTDSSYAASFGKVSTLSTVSAGSTVTINGGGIHNLFGNIDNSGSILISQQAYLQQNPGAGGQTADWVGHDTLNGNLNNRAGALIQLNDVGSQSAPTYDWYIRSLLNEGTIQWCGRGDTGGSTYQFYVDNDGNNNGLISYEQAFSNLGAAYVWRNSVLTTTTTGSNLYNNGAFRLINVVYHNVQNVYGTGCWIIGPGGVLYLEDGTGVFQNPTGGPSFPQQSITFQDSTAVVHMDTAVYSRNPNFGPQIYGFSSGNAFEFYEIIRTFSYSEATGILTVTMGSTYSVNIKLGTGYTAANFYQARNPQKYNLVGYNAIFYRGAAPAQTVPSQCSIGLTQAVCSGVPTLPQLPSPSSSSVVSTSSASATTSNVPVTSPTSSTMPITTSNSSSSSSTSSVLSTTTSPSVTTSSSPSTTISSTVSSSASSTSTKSKKTSTKKTSSKKPSKSSTKNTGNPTASTKSTKTSGKPTTTSKATTTAKTKTTSSVKTGSPIKTSRTTSSSSVKTGSPIKTSRTTSTSTKKSTNSAKPTATTKTTKTTSILTTKTSKSSVTTKSKSTTTKSKSISTKSKTTSSKSKTTSTKSKTTSAKATKTVQVCAKQTGGAGPVAKPDTASGFLNYAAFHTMARSAPTTIPAADGSTYVQAFRDKRGASRVPSYSKAILLQSYNVTQCAARCDANTNCTAFNLYIERDPSLKPDARQCPKPPSITTYRCNLWGSELDESTTTYHGGRRVEFRIRVTGSNGYNKRAAS